MASIQFANAFSETFPLSENIKIVRMAELQTGDRLVGSFTLSNIPVAKDILGNEITYKYSVTIYDPNGQRIRQYEQTTSDSFDFTATTGGNYKIEFYIHLMGGELYLHGLGNACATLRYDIVKASQTAQASDVHSETFQLFESNSVGRTVNLNKGDQLVGDYEILNCPVSYGVIIYDPNHEAVLAYDNKDQASFSTTAFYTGQYTIQFNTAMNQYYNPNGFPFVQATLNYQVVSASQSEPSLTGNLPDWLLPLLIAIIIFGIIGIVVYWAKTRKC